MIFGFGRPVIFPTKSIKKLFEKLAAIDMFHTAHTGDKPLDIAFAISTEFVGGAVTVVAGAFARNDEPRIDDGTDEGHAFVYGLLVLLFGMESETKLAKEELANNFDVAEELGALRFGDDDKEVVNIATVMLITEIETNEAVKLVKEDVRKELRGEIADDDAATVGLGEETFGFREGTPVGTATANGDVFHRLVINDFAPEVFENVIKSSLIGRMTTDTVFYVRAMAVIELLLEPPEDALVEFIMVEAHEISLNI